MKLTYNLPKEVETDSDDLVLMLTDNQWFDWVTKVERHDDGITISIKDPYHSDDSDKMVTQTFTSAQIVEVVQNLNLYKDEVWAQTLISDLLEEDVDSISQDLFWQFAVLGDIFYS